ncbi:MAG TPA: amidophosphoribosyltransferase [Dielma fastidiosa]|nr:amidophosphoribosyltransferase [Dielma fastidiosa]
MKHWCPICFKSVDEHQPFMRWLKGEDSICGKCRANFEECNENYQLHALNIHAFYYYNDYVENLLFQYKEGRDIALAEVFLAAVREELFDRCRHKVLIPMPSAQRKISERGFSHLHEMLKGMNIECCDCLVKSEDYKQSLHRGKSRGQIKNVMKLKSAAEIPTKKLVLFDDVCTSGSTLLAAYDLLREYNDQITAEVICVHRHFVETCDEN